MKCPHCGSKEIDEVRSVVMRIPVLSWEENRPVDYGEDLINYDSYDSLEYECSECRSEFPLSTKAE